MNKNKKEGIFAVAVLSVILLSSSVIALGVAIPYWDSPEWFPLKLAPGESGTVILTLQNTEDNDISLEAIVTSDIATLEDENNIYFVPSGEVNKPARIRVEIPEDAEIGTTYNVIVSFTQVTPSGEGGMLRVAGAITASFPVEVVGTGESKLREGQLAAVESKTTGQGLSKLWIPAILILIIVVLAILIRKSKK